MKCGKCEDKNYEKCPCICHTQDIIASDHYLLSEQPMKKTPWLKRKLNNFRKGEKFETI